MIKVGGGVGGTTSSTAVYTKTLKCTEESAKKRSNKVPDAGTGRE